METAGCFYSLAVSSRDCDLSRLLQLGSQGHVLSKLTSVQLHFVWLRNGWEPCRTLCRAIALSCLLSVPLPSLLSGF